jgi:ribosomal protein S18 acetylase RimI-like enzyme
MLRDQIEYKEGTNIPPDILQQLFRKEEWNDFLDLDEIQIHLDKALYLVSAWNEQELVGYARLEGDGRISVEISDVLVKSEYQGMGIGTELVKRLVMRIEEMDPYFIQVEPISDREVHLYAKFGFCEIRNYRRMELITKKLTSKVAEVRGKKDTPDIEQSGTADAEEGVD